MENIHRKQVRVWGLEGSGWWSRVYEQSRNCVTGGDTRSLEGSFSYPDYTRADIGGQNSLNRGHHNTDSKLVGETREGHEGEVRKEAPGEVVISCCNNSMLKSTE